jgi:hypothetical protein
MRCERLGVLEAPQPWDGDPGERLPLGSSPGPPVHLGSPAIDALAKLRDADVLTEDVSQKEEARPTDQDVIDPGTPPRSYPLDPRRKTEVRGASLQMLQEVVDVLRSKGAGEVAVGPGVAVDGRDGADYVHARVLEVADLALGRRD